MTLPPLPEPDAEMPIKWPDGKRTREPLWMRDRMDSYARAAVEAEREACARLCEQITRRQHDEHVSKAREWHRRMQQAEAANYQHLKALERAQGVPLSSFARALTYGAMRVAEGERDAARAECDALRALLAEARGALLEVRAHMHAAGRRPETCHEMSVIDEVLMTLRSER